VGGEETPDSLEIVKIRYLSTTYHDFPRFFMVRRGGVMEPQARFRFWG